MSENVPEFGVGYLADGVGKVMHIREGDKRLAGDEHLH